MIITREDSRTYAIISKADGIIMDVDSDNIFRVRYKGEVYEFRDILYAHAFFMSLDESEKGAVKKQ